MKKTVHVAYEDFLAALKSLGYYQAKEGWRRHLFHITLRQRRRGRLTIDIHLDIYSPYPLGGHRAKHKGKELDEEFKQIMAAYMQQRRHAKSLNLPPFFIEKSSITRFQKH